MWVRAMITPFPGLHENARFELLFGSFAAQENHRVDLRPYRVGFILVDRHKVHGSIPLKDASADKPISEQACR